MATTNANHTTALNLYDAVGDQVVAARATNVSSVNGETYGDLVVSATVTATNPSVGTDSAAVPGSETLIGAKDGSGNLKPAQTDGTNLLVKDANSAAAKADLDTIVTNTTGLATQATLLAVKVDLDTLVLNTADLLVDGDNLATIVTNTGNIPAKGTAAMAASTPVTIATNDTVFAEVLTDLDNLATIAGAISAGKMQTTISNANPNGQATMAASAPVALASNQSPVPVNRSVLAVYSLPSTLENANGNSGDLTVGPYTEISIDCNMTASAGTNPTVQFFWDRKGADNVYYPIYQSAVFSTFSATTYLSTSIGAGMVYAQSLGTTGRLRWVIGGTASPSVTFSANVQSK